MDTRERVEPPTAGEPPGSCTSPASALHLVDEFAAVAEPAALLRTVVHRMVVETVSDRGIISWIEDEEMIVADCHDPFGEVVPAGSRWPLEASEVNRVARATGLAVRGGIGIDMSGLSPALQQAYASLHHLLVAPVTLAGEHIAMLCVSRRREEEFTDKDKSVLALIARVAAQPLLAVRLRQQCDVAMAELRTKAAVAESVERVKTDILRLASHELRTPLTVLNGYLSLIEEGFFGEIPVPLAEIMSILSRRTADINRLVNDMLVAARAEDGATTDVGTDADVRDVVRQAVASVESRTDNRHSFAVVVPDTPVVSRIHVERVTLAIRNIVDNAVKYSPSGGEVRCTVTVDGNVARVVVSDVGLGIAPSDRDRLFSRFGRILTTANSHIQGIGLGLFFSREVARRHGGDVILTEAPGAVTAFEFSLPLAGA